jgi:hypothetical protein
MANSFLEGISTGEAQQDKIRERSDNPFNVILGRFDEAEARRYKEGEVSRKEEAELKKALMVLQYQSNYDKELAKIKEEESRKTELEKQEGEITSTERLIKSFGGNVPRGTTAKVGAFNIPINPEYTEGESQILNYADTLAQDIDEMVGILKSPKSKEAQLTSKIPSIFGLTPEAGGSASGQQFKLLNQRIGQSILYMKTGKQINEQEYRRFKDMLAKFSRKDELDIENMQKFKGEMERVSGRIKGGTLWDEKQKKFTGGEQQSAKTKAQRANEVAQTNPNLTREQIIQKVNQEFGQ